MSIPEIKVTGRVLTLSQSTLARNPDLAGGGVESEQRGVTSNGLTASETRIAKDGSVRHPVTAWPSASGSSAPPARPSRIRQSSKPLLNGLETEWYHILKRSYGPDVPVFAQALRFRLGNGIWYKPDFVVFGAAKFYGYEVKGPHAFRGGFENLKVCAHLYREIKWYLVWKVSDQWQEQEVLP